MYEGNLLPALVLAGLYLWLLCSFVFDVCCFHGYARVFKVSVFVPRCGCTSSEYLKGSFGFFVCAIFVLVDYIIKHASQTSLLSCA